MSELKPEQNISVEIVSGIEGLCLLVNDYRVAGPKPWGGGTVTQSFKTKLADIERAIYGNRRAQPENEPPCYLPEQNNPYPLCVGRGMAVCAHCCLWADYDQDENESRVNHPLTLEELRGMVGEWVWVEHMDSPASQAAPGEWLKLKTCEPTRLDPYIRFEGKGLCALYYGQSWLAYRRKPEGRTNDF